MLSPSVLFTYLVFQLRVTAHDSGDDARVATADVMITVLRNPEAPEFKENRYRVTVSPEAILGEPILNVTAEDDDGVSVKMIILYIW